MALILSIETSTPLCSVSLSFEGQNILSLEHDGTHSHAEVLNDEISNLLKKSNQLLSSLKAIAISAGPGSYTGLRIGLSAAKGLCFALQIPLISINTLESMAYSKSYSLKRDLIYCPVIISRKNEVYMAQYFQSGEEITGPCNLDLDCYNPNTFSSEFSFLIFGSGAEKVGNILKSDHIIIDKSYTQTAKDIEQLAFMRYNKKVFESIAYCEPFYLKDVYIGRSTKK